MWQRERGGGEEKGETHIDASRNTVATSETISIYFVSFFKCSCMAQEILVHSFLWQNIHNIELTILNIHKCPV